MNEGKRGEPYAYSDTLMLLAIKERTSGRPRAKMLGGYGEPGQYGEGTKGSAWNMTRIILLTWQLAHQDIKYG
ncbi:MAG: hypothetical protein QXI38_02520 [Conexivisphaerales archaeon]